MSAARRGLAALLLAALPALCACEGPDASPAGEDERPARQETALSCAPAGVLGGVETDRRVVSLIFEGYSDAESMSALTDLLAARGVETVFFLSGVTADEHPEAVRAIREAGLGVGSYGMTGRKGAQGYAQRVSLRMLTRAQALLEQACGETPSLLCLNGAPYTPSLLQAAAAAGLESAVQPDVYVNHRSFGSAAAAEGFVRRLVRGSVISVKLGQELDALEYGRVVDVNEFRPMDDPEPSLSRAQEDIPRSVYASLGEGIGWLLDALKAEGYAIVSPQALQAERVTLLGQARALTKEEEVLVGAAAPVPPVTAQPLLAGETRAGTLEDFSGTVFVGGSAMAGLAGYVKARRGEDASFMPGAQFVAVPGLTVEGALAAHGAGAGLAASLAGTGAQRILMMLPVDDFGAAQAALPNVRVLLHQMKESCPDAQLCVLSCPPERGAAAEDNGAILRYNMGLWGLCLQYGLCFIDTASALRDGQGALAQAYCMDAQAGGAYLSAAGCEALLQYLSAHVPL